MAAHHLAALRALSARHDSTIKDDSPDTIGRKLKQQLAIIERNCAELELLRANPDKMKSKLANDLLETDAQIKLKGRIAEARSRAEKLLNDHREMLQKDQWKKAALGENQYAAEFRRVFRELKTDMDKVGFMKKAIDNGDCAAVSAIVCAPPSLSGLSAEQVAHYKDAYLSRFSEGNTEYVEDLDAIVNATLQTAESLAGPNVVPAKPAQRVA